MLGCSVLDTDGSFSGEISHLGRAHCSRITTKQSPLWLQWDAQIHPQTAPSLRQSSPLFNTAIRQSTLNLLATLDRPLLPSQTAFGSNQPFFHSTFCRETDRWDRR